MANRKSEGPFLLLNTGNIAGREISTDGSSTSAYAFKTRAGLERYIENNKTSTAEFLVFDAVSKVSFEHTVHYGAVNAK